MYGGLRVPLAARRSNQSILKEINLEYSQEGLILKLQHLGHLMQRADSLEKTLVLGKTEGKRRSTGQRMECEETSGDSEGPGGLSCHSPWGRRVGHDFATVQ